MEFVVIYRSHTVYSSLIYKTHLAYIPSVDAAILDHTRSRVFSALVRGREEVRHLEFLMSGKNANYFIYFNMSVLLFYIPWSIQDGGRPPCVFFI